MTKIRKHTKTPPKTLESVIIYFHQVDNMRKFLPAHTAAQSN